MGRINRYASLKRPANVKIFAKQYTNNNKVYSEKLRNKSLSVLSALPIGEEELNDAADHVYGNGYSGEDRADYELGLEYDYVVNWLY